MRSVLAFAIAALAACDAEKPRATLDPKLAPPAGVSAGTQTGDVIVTAAATSDPVLPRQLISDILALVSQALTDTALAGPLRVELELLLRDRAAADRQRARSATKPTMQRAAERTDSLSRTHRRKP
ncbi:MAG: hypothetical protein ACT443_14055 [Gemmatimonadota bacterium]